MLTIRSTIGFGQKLLSVLSVATTVLLDIAVVGAAAVQPDLSLTMLIGFCAAVVVGVGAWVILPKWSRVDPGWHAAAPLPLASSERAARLGTARFPIWLIVAILVPTLLVSAVSSWVAAQRGGLAWLLMAIPVVMTFVVLSATDWRVRAHAAGLRVRSIVGLPRWTIPVGDIAEAGTTTVAPLGEFGGWGLRWSGCRQVGIITRGGGALEVRHRDGSSLVITVDDAESAAAC